MDGILQCLPIALLVFVPITILVGVRLYWASSNGFGPADYVHCRHCGYPQRVRVADMRPGQLTASLCTLCYDYRLNRMIHEELQLEAEACEKAEVEKRLNRTFDNRVISIQKVTSTFYTSPMSGSVTPGLDEKSSSARTLNGSLPAQQQLTFVEGDLPSGGEDCCTICYEGRSSVLLLPCGHSGLCDNCVGNVLMSVNNPGTCHICRHAVMSIATITKGGNQAALLPLREFSGGNV